MQLVYGHCGNLGNECADHAAALGTFGLTSNHSVATRWIHNNFDAFACFDDCQNLNEILERLQRVRLEIVSVPKFGARIVIESSGLSCISRSFWLFCVLLFSAFSLFECHAMVRHSSSVSTVPSLDDDFEHNTWNPLLNLLLLEQVSGIFASISLIST